MTDVKYIRNIVEEIIKDSELFLTDVSVSASNEISVTVDSMNGVPIETCISLSKQIESNLDRDKEDFELQVSSAGIGQPFKVIQQYRKNLGNEVEVLTFDGRKIKGTLSKLDEEKGFEIEYEEKEKAEGKKKKVLVKKQLFFNFSDIKYIKDIISF